MRKTRNVVRFALWTVLGLALAFVAFMARLSMGPLSLSAIDGLLRSPVEQILPGYELSFETPSVYWNKTEDTLDIQVSQVRITDDTGLEVIQAPFVGLAVNRYALFTGEIQPTRLDVIGSSFDIKWSADRLAALVRKDPSTSERAENDEPVGAANSENTNQDSSQFVVLLDRLLSGDKGEGPLSYLRRVTLLNANIQFEEVKTGTVWAFPNAKLDLSLKSSGVHVGMKIEMAGEEHGAVISVNTSDKAPNERVVELLFNQVNIAELAKEVGLNAPFNLVDGDLFGVVHGKFDQESHLTAIEFSLGAEEADLQFAELYPDGPRHVEQFEFTGRFDPIGRHLEVQRLGAELGAGTIIGDGFVNAFEEGKKPEIKLNAVLSNMPIPDLMHYWPASLASGGHHWMSENMPSGAIKEARFALAIEPDDWDARKTPESLLRIDILFDDLVAHYLSPMAPIIGGTGRGLLTPNSLILDIDEGTIGGQNIAGSQFEIVNMSVHGRQEGRAKIQISAGLSNLLSLIDSDPLNLSTKFGIDPAEIKGQSIATAYLAFPLHGETSLADVEVNVTAEVSELTIPALMSGGGLTNGNLNLSVTKSGLSANGPIELRGVPVELYWTEQFNAPQGTPSSRFELSGEFNAAAFAAFGVPAEGRLEGSAQVNAIISGSTRALQTGVVTVDLFRAKINAPKLAWTKRANVPGSLRLNLNWQEKGLGLENMVIQSEGMDMAGQFLIDTDSGDIREANIDFLRSDGHDLSLTSKLDDAGRFELVIDADRLALQAYLSDLVGGQGTGYVPQAMILITAREMTALNGVVINNFGLDAWNSGGYWTTASMEGTFADGRSFGLELDGGVDGRRLHISADDAGEIALGVGLFVNGKGGKLALNATLNGKGEPSHSEGELVIEDFRVVKTSALLQALEESKGYQVDDLIDQNGMVFDELRMPFVVNDDVIDMSDAHANGPTTGFTMEGQYDQRQKRLNVNGLIIPAYSINSLLGKIPLIGPILTGGDGALFALAYRIQGDISEPEVSFNPLSAIAPGFLRRIFQGRKGAVEDIQEPVEPVNPTAAPDSEKNRR